MRFLSAFLVALVLWMLASASAEEIHAPWSPGESWDYDRTSSQWHVYPNDNCVDFNKNGGDDEGSPMLSVSDGQVIISGWSSTYGWNVKIERTDGSLSSNRSAI